MAGSNENYALLQTSAARDDRPDVAALIMPMRRSRMGYWSVALEGEGSNCFSITQLVGQKKAIINSAEKIIYLGIKQNE